LRKKLGQRKMAVEPALTRRFLRTTTAPIERLKKVITEGYSRDGVNQ
jgi:hypothetical protein